MQRGQEPHTRGKRRRRPDAGLPLRGVHVWLVDCREIPSRLLRSLPRLLSRTERARLRQAQVPAEHTQSLVGRALIRCGLSAYTGLRAEHVPLCESRHGKPELADARWNRRVQFNLSHSAGLVVCAFTAHSSIGLDVEHGQRDVDADAIAEAFFAPHEIADIKSRPAHLRAHRFFTYWTLKEAFLKARGVGLTVSLAGAPIQLALPRARLATPDCSNWQLALLPYGAHLIAIAVNQGWPARAQPTIDTSLSIIVRPGLRLLRDAANG